MTSTLRRSLHRYGNLLVFIAVAMLLTNAFELVFQSFFLLNAQDRPNLVVIGLLETSFDGLVGSTFGYVGWISLFAWSAIGLTVCYRALRIGLALRGSDPISKPVIMALKKMSYAVLFFLIIRSIVSCFLAYLARSINPDISLNVQTTGILWVLFLSLLCFTMGRILTRALQISEENKGFV